MRLTALFCIALLVSVCGCGDDSNPLDDSWFKRGELLGQWNASAGGVTIKGYKMEWQDTTVRQFDILFDSLTWDLRIDSSSYNLKVEAVNPGVYYDHEESGYWLVSVSNPDRVRFERNYAVHLTRYDSVDERGTRRMIYGDDLPYPRWDCLAVVSGERLLLSEIDSTLGLPVDSVTLYRK